MNRAPSMNGGRRIRLKTQAEKIARRIRRHGKAASALQSPQTVQLLPSNLLSVDGLVEELEGKEKSMLLDIVRTLRQSDLTEIDDIADGPISPRDSNDTAQQKAEMLLHLDMETLKRIAHKSEPSEVLGSQVGALPAASPSIEEADPKNGEDIHASGGTSEGDADLPREAAAAHGMQSEGWAESHKPQDKPASSSGPALSNTDDARRDPGRQVTGPAARAPVYTARSSELVQKGLTSLRIALHADPTPRTATPDSLPTRRSDFSPLPSPLRSAFPVPRARPGTGASATSFLSEMQLPSAIIAKVRSRLYRQRGLILPRDALAAGRNTPMPESIHSPLSPTRHLPAQASESGLDEHPRADDEELGLQWERVSEKWTQGGLEIHNAPLATALETKTEFSVEEWQKFNLNDLSLASFIKVNSNHHSLFFKPVAPLNAKQRQRLEFEIVSSQNVYLLACEKVGTVPKKQVRAMLERSHVDRVRQ